MTSAAVQLVVDNTHRRRNRNAVRDVAILPPDVDAKAAALETLDAETQARAVSVMLTHAAMQLSKANDAQSILEWKAKAGAIQALTKQLQLGKQIRLDAMEFVRRTERALGVAIREGQARGTVETTTEARIRGANQWRLNEGSSTKSSEDVVDLGQKTRVSDLLSKTEQTGGRSPEFSVFSMVDGVSEEQFNEALAEARAEGNLSRANVARKAKAKAVQAAPEHIQPQPPLEPKRRLTKHDSTEMLANINGMLNGIVESLPFIDPADIDGAANKTVINNIRQSMGKIRTLLKGIENG